MSKVMVSIVCITYNHEKYIKDALEGFLSQKVNFEFEVIVHDDASTDQTAQIVKAYEAKYPNIIRGIYQKENQNSKGKDVLRFVFPYVRGRYVAHCEGDDYWTDPLKLQKQVSFLESNPEYIGTVHNVRCVDEKGELIHEGFQFYPIQEEHVYGKKNAMTFALAGQTASLVHKNIFKDWTKKEGDLYVSCKANGDRKMNVLLGLLGDIYYFRDIMADHRMIFHSGGSWSARNMWKNLLYEDYKLRLEISKFLKAYNGTIMETKNSLDSLVREGWIKFLSESNKENLKVLLNLFKEKIKKFESVDFR